ncbi:hypothetical protein CHS0354_023408 [Potamilus streckersoni]|uniref:Protocadherin Fat 4 n=1 Tax=Potamilus streckersoni TaxID=2493646 RepID=A0AAE0RXU4_9BIVA|nr:hypothetical protein CHS0354_023408 [Potamilus streckersoni]
MLSRQINLTELSLLFLLFVTHWGWTSPTTTTEINSPTIEKFTNIPPTNSNLYSDTFAPNTNVTTPNPSSSMSTQSKQITTTITTTNSVVTTSASPTSSRSPANCSALNCSSGGNCVFNTSSNIAECICRPLYSGTFCELGPCNANPGPCPANTSCHVVNDAPYCQCRGDFKGLNCTEVDTLVTCQDNPIQKYLDLKTAGNTPISIICLPNQNTSSRDYCNNPGEGIVYTLRNESSFLQILRQGNNDCLAVTNVSLVEHTFYTVTLIATEEDDVQFRSSRNDKLDLELTFNKDPIINPSVFVFNVDGRDTPFNFTVPVVDPEMQNIWVDIIGVFPLEYKSIVKNVGTSSQFQITKPTTTIPDNGVDITVQIKVNDSGVPPAMTRGNFTLKLVSLVCSVSNNSIYIDTNADLSKPIATIFCIKKGPLTLFYSVNQTSSGNLKISGNDTSAQVFLTSNSVTRYQTAVHVDASIDSANSSSIFVSVSMNVTVADLKPKCSSQNLTAVSFSENASLGLCSDVAYTCQNNLSSSMTCRDLYSTTLFNLSCVTGANGALSLKVCTAQSLGGHVGNFTVNASVENYHGSSGILSIDVMVTNINDAPHIVVGTNVLAVHEDVSLNSTILSVNVTDEDLPFGDILTSSINSTDISVTLPFRIVQHGVDIGSKTVVFDIQVIQALNASKQQVYNLTIQVQDKAGLFSTAPLSVNVIDVNQPPICPSSVTVRGNITTPSGTILGTVQCDDVDVDPGYKSITYAISTGELQVVKDTLSVFSNGSINLITNMRNIENISSFKIEASDSGGLKTNVTVNIIINSNFPPRCSPSVVTVNISENIAANICLPVPNLCVNPVENDQLIFTNFTGNGTDLFQKNANASQLAPCTKIALKGQIGIYVVNIEVHNSYGTATLSMYVMVVDENDPPVFNTTKYMTSIDEEKPLGTTVLSVTASDPDTGAFGIITYKSDGMPAFFKLNGTNGVISVAGVIDAENITSLNVTFIVQAISGEFTVNATVTVIIIDINDNDPVCSNPNPGEVSIDVFDSPGKLIYNFSCWDQDVSPQYSALVFSLVSSTPQAVFNISRNGDVKIASKLPLINGNYNLQIKVQDNDTYVRQGQHGLNTSLTVVVNTTYPPSCNPHFINETVDETHQASCISQEVICTDPAYDPLKNLTMQVGKAIGNATSFLEIKEKTTAVTGKIGLSACLNSSIKGLINTYQMKTIVSNVLGQTEVVWMVKIDDVNDAPYFSSQNYTANVVEDYGNITMKPLITLEVFDPDINTPAFHLSNDSITATLLYPADPQAIILIGNILYQEQTLNATRYNEYKFALTVTDKQGLTGNATATVYVRDMNEVPICPQTQMTVKTSLDASAGATLLHIFCYDTDREDAYRRLNYTISLVDQNFHGIFNVTNTGDLVLLTKFPRTLAVGNTILHVEVSDEGTPPLFTIVTVNVTINREIPAKCNPTTVPPSSWVINSCMTLMMNCSDPTTAVISHLQYTFNGNFSVGFNLTDTSPDGVFKFCYTLVGSMYDNTYLINVSVNNNLTVVTYPVTVTVVYQASTPRFSSQSYNVDAGENTKAQQTIMNVSATVATGTVSYSIIDDNSTLGSYFRINETTGVVTSTKDLMPISNQNVTLNVQALNPESQLKSTATVFIRVIDINSAPVCNITQTEYNISVTAAADTVIFNLVCFDNDTNPDNSHVSYNISGSNVATYFQLKENISLTLRTKSLLSVTVSRYNITFTAQDSGIPPLNFQKMLIINVNLTPPLPIVTAVSNDHSTISISWEYARAEFVNITNGFVLSVKGGATDTRYEFQTNVSIKEVTSLIADTLYNISITAVTKYGNVTAVKTVRTKAIPVITSLTFTIRMTGIDFTDDLRNTSNVKYNTTRDKLVQSLDVLLRRFQGYSGASLLSFRRGSVLVDAKVSVDQTGNISNIQTAIQQSVSSGYIGLNGTTIAVDSTYFIAYIGDGYSMLDSIINVTDAVGIYNGSTVNITCIAIVVGNAQPEFTWKYNKNMMSPVNGSRISISDIIVDSDTPQKKYNSVSFRQIQSSDSGTYECVITDQFLRPSTMNVSVYVLSQPVVSIQPLTQTVDAGATVNITCKVENNVTLTQMVWYRNGANFNSTNKLSEETFSIAGTTYILTRRNITSRTVYECYGVNNAGPGEKRQANISVILLGSEESVTCNNETDYWGTKWSRTLQDTYDIKSCPPGMSGEAKRYCLAGGVWGDASYDNCINNALLDLQTQTDNIKNGLAPNTVPESLVKLTNVTNPNNVELQKAEVQVVSRVLDNVIQISNNTKNITNIEVENFLQIASNVIDEKNSPSWQALIAEDKEGASVVLKNVEQYSRLKAQLINSTGEPVKFIKKNLFVEIGYKPVSDIQFPKANGSAFTNSSVSGYFLSRDVLSNGNFTSYSGAYFNNVSGVIQKNVLRDGSITNREDVGINSAVLSLQLDPSPASLSPPLILTFKHFSAYYSNPVCSFWKFNADGNDSGAWSSQGCKLVSTNDDTTVCECDHLTNFAILMSPGKTPDKDQVPLSIISLIGCAISIFCLSVTMLAHFVVWRYVKSDRTSLLMNLCLALIISYVIFLAGVDRTENKNACTAVAALLHYFYLAVFFLMLAYGIELAVTVVYVFETRSRVRWLLPLAWILPAVVVAVSLGVTQLEGYGNEKFCWLSIEDGLIWAFVGPAALVILLNFIIILLVFHRMFSSSAMLTKSDKIKAKSAARSLCVLLPITGITWVFGILSVNEDLVVFQYLFAIINSLQGLFISMFYCFFNRHLREAMKQNNAARKRSQASYSATLKSSSRSSGQIKFDSLDESRKNNASDIIASSKNPFLQADRQMQKLVEKYAKDGQPVNDFLESSKNIKEKRSGSDASLEDVKITNILRESEVRKDPDHTEVATTSPLISAAGSSIDRDTGESKFLGESRKYDYIDASRLDKSQSEHQTALEPIFSPNLRTSADGQGYQILGQKSSQSYDQLVPKSGFNPHDPRYDKSSRYDQDQTSSKERLSITPDKGIISSLEKQSTSHEIFENFHSKRASKDEVYDTGQSASGAKVPVSNSKNKPSKDSKGHRRSSKSRKSDEEYKHLRKIRSPFEYMTTIQPKSTIIRIQVQSKEARKDSKYAKRKAAELEPNRGRPSTRASKAKDIISAKKRSRDRSKDYEYSAYDMAYMGPQVYHSSAEHVAEYIAYNPYVAYGGQQISPVDPWQYYQPHSQQTRKSYW